MQQSEYQKFINYLFTYQDLKYQEFTRKLTHTKYEIIGIRIPTLRKITKEIMKGDYHQFLNMVKTHYFEEVFLSFLVIASITDEKEFTKYFVKFLPKIDDWSICDSFCNSIKIIQKHPSKYFDQVLKLLDSSEEFTIRTGLITILNNYIDINYLPKIFSKINKITNEAYYVNMGIAWLLCEIFIYYPKQTEEFFKNSKINDFTMNKTISKIKESYRVSIETKEYLNRYKRKRVKS